ncbi:glycosyl transferase family protein, partial [mine drainage metagenome]
MSPTPASPGRSWLRALLLALLVATANFGLWAWVNRPVDAPGWTGPIHGFAYSAYRRFQSPLTGDYPTPAEISADLAMLSHYTHRIRTYASLQTPEIPRLARNYGMHVMAGAWLDSDKRHNEKELQALIE